MASKVKNGFLIDYYNEQLTYEKKYGKKTVVLIEKGEFMEIYGINSDVETIGNIHEVCKILDITCTLTNSKKDGNNKENPYLAGFPTYSMQRHIDALLDEKYTIVLKTQTKRVGKSFEREVTEIISPGVYLNAKPNESSNIVCITSEYNIDYKTKQRLLTLGISMIDVTTGMSIIYEVSDKHNDSEYAINEAYRFIQTANPKQVLVDKDVLVDLLELNDMGLEYSIVTRSSVCEKLDYKKKFFNKVFVSVASTTILESLGLDRYHMVSVSYLYLLNFVYERNKNFIQHLQQPVYWSELDHMVLHNNTIFQLDLVSKDSTRQTLCKLLNNCRTNMGKRLFETRLLNPLVSPVEIRSRYELIDTLLSHEDSIPFITVCLTNIYDTERLFRRLSLSAITPYSLSKVYQSLCHTQGIMQKLQTLKISKQFGVKLKPVDVFIKYFDTTYNIGNLERYSSLKKDITFNIFNKGVHCELDTLTDEYTELYASLETYVATMNDSIDGKESYFKLKLEKKGYCVEITKTRFQTYLKKTSLEDKKYLVFEKIPTTSSVKLRNAHINGINNDLHVNTERLNSLMKEFYSLHIDDINDMFREYYVDISTFIAVIDVTVNNSKMARTNIYCKPEIDSGTDIDRSYVNAMQLRHPIVEQINTSEKYIPNDIMLGKEETGMILFGLNAGGKSTVLKALGICIIMAQSGLYVPCKSMKYKVYKHLLSRILGNDNLSKGLSSFEVEIMELKTILQRADNHSMVLGDEVCRGSEIVSAISLVASSIIELSKRNTTFIFTTHLHKLNDLECIKTLTNVGIYHLKVIIDGDKIIYDRTLQNGQGLTIYGLEVARAMHMNDAFIKQSYDIRAILLNEVNKILPEKTSRYNANIIVSKCTICDETGVDTHHINFQCTANEHGNIGHFHKNIDHNLVVLCKRCHTRVHTYKLRIYGWIKTSDGLELSYENVKRADRVEYQKEIEYIATDNV
jgi:DNA mismatch repair protein MutS